MLIYIGVFIFAVIMGIINGFSWMYYDRLSFYLKERGESDNYYKYIHTLFGWLVIIICAFTMFFLPIMIISFFTKSDCPLKVRGVIADIYVYVSIATLLITFVVLVKMGKIKISGLGK